MAGPAIQWIKSPAGFLKLISLLLISICIGVYFYFGTSGIVGGQKVGGVFGLLGLKTPTTEFSFFGGFSNRGSDYLAHVVLSTIFFILLYYLISFIAGESEPREYLVTELLFLFIHAILAIVSGCLVFGWKEPHEYHYIYFVLMLIVGLVMIIDAVLSLIQFFRGRNRDYF